MKKYHSTGKNAAHKAPMARIRRQDMPATRSTKTPAAATSNEVPRSGCLAMRAVGTTMRAAATSRRGRLGGRGRSDRYQATMAGTATFTISEG